MGNQVSMQGVIKGAPQVEDDRVVYVIETSAVNRNGQIYPIKTKVELVYTQIYMVRKEKFKIFMIPEIW